MKRRLQDAAGFGQANGFADSTATRRGTEAALRVASFLSPGSNALAASDAGAFTLADSNNARSTESAISAGPRVDWTALEERIQAAARAAACLHMLEVRGGSELSR